MRYLLLIVTILSVYISTAQVGSRCVNCPPPLSGHSGQFLTNNGTSLNWATVAGGDTSQSWHLIGNSGTNPSTDFIGTIGEDSLFFGVNGTRSGSIDAALSNTSFGFGSAPMLTGSSTANSAFGHQAMISGTSGSSNSAFGYRALFVNSTGGSNSAFGVEALFNSTTSSSNTAFGYQGLYGNLTGTLNTAIGRQSGLTVTTGSRNTFLGSGADAVGAGVISGISIGYNAKCLDNQAFFSDSTFITTIRNSSLQIGGTFKQRFANADSITLTFSTDTFRLFSNKAIKIGSGSVIIGANGNFQTSSFKFTNGAGSGKAILSDASGNATWTTLTKSDVGLGNVDNTSDAAKPVSTAQATAIAAASVIQIASATGVDGAALGTTALTFGSGITLATHVPLFYIVKFNSGVTGICVAKVKNTSGDLTATTALLGVINNVEAYIANATPVPMPNSGNVSVEITTASLAPSSFNIYAYGISRP